MSIDLSTLQNIKTLLTGEVNTEFSPKGLKVVCNGAVLTNVTNVQIQQSLDSPVGTFYFDAVGIDNSISPVDVGSTISIVTDTDVLLKTGYVFSKTFEYTTSRGATYSYQGRDITADLVDSSIGTAVAFTKNKTIHGIIQDTLDAIESPIRFVDKLANIIPFSSQIISDPTVNVIAFFQKLARIKGGVISTSPEGSLVLSRNLPLITINLTGGEDLILSLDYTKEGSGVYNRRNLLFQWRDGKEKLTDSKTTIHNSDVRKGRVITTNTSQPMKIHDAELQNEFDNATAEGQEKNVSLSCVGIDNIEGMLYNIGNRVVLTMSQENFIGSFIIQDLTITYTEEGGLKSFISGLGENAYKPKKLKEPKTGVL